ncbi:MAG: toll/interleukin-1 receptor domain-containing protein [bacterium]|nr:toll/interleukin-1 receptor domain-containing protein [bacterium]
MPPANGRHDVFISYSSQDRKTAARIAEGLISHGLKVWWDRDLLPGEEFTDRIEELLDASACVAVLWSAHSIKSRFVRNESEHAAQRDKLVPALIEAVEIPFHVRNIHTLDLINWKGDPNDAAFLKFVDGVRQRIDTEHVPGSTTVLAGRGRSRRTRAAVAAGLVAAMLSAAWFLGGRTIPGFGPDAEAELPDLAQTALTGDGTTNACRISPDGRRLLLVRAEQGEHACT